MEFKKLDRRHNLYHKGYRYAYVFRGYEPRKLSEYQITELVRKAEDMDWFDHTFYGKSDGVNRRAYYIGFKNESTHTLVQLQM